MADVGGITEQVQRPSVGRIVWFYPSDSDALYQLNGATCHPALITRVWTDEMVNLTVFPDGTLDAHVATRRTSIKLESNETTRNAHWTWPTRI